MIDSISNLALGDLNHGLRDVEAVVNAKTVPMFNTLAIIKQKETGAFWVQTIYKALATIDDVAVIIASLGGIGCIFLLLSNFHANCSVVKEIMNSRESQSKAARHAHNANYTPEETDLLHRFSVGTLN